jgi:zinc protease
MRRSQLLRRCRPLLLALLCAGLFAAPWTAARGAEPAPDKKADTAAALQAAAALYEGIRAETLPNGLRVYLKPIKDSPVVTTMVAYKVGSCDEDLDHTGLSHYLEHLMFKGTDKIKPGDIDRLTLRNGGMNNAYTSEDYTIFFFDFAADRWEGALEIEADRMRNLRIDTAHEFEQEKGAVIAELDRDEDEPWDLEMKAIVPMLFGKESPYGHPVIGERQHVRQATAEVIKSHYDKWYYPNNAALVICGGFDPDKVMARVKELFGPLPKGNLPARKTVRDEKPRRPARLEMDSKFEVPRLLMGFNTISTADPDFPVFEVIQSLLAGGKTGRLYRALVEGEEVASNVSAGNNAGRYPGWFSVQVQVLPGKDRAQTEKLVLKELRRLSDEPVSAAEMNRVQQGVLSDAIFSREGAHNLADSIARGVTTNDLDFLRNYLPSIMAVTAQDVQRVARKYLNPEERVVVWSVPKEKAGGAGRGAGAEPLRRTGRYRRHDKPAEGVGQGLSLKDAKRVELPNGLVLLLYENHRLPIITAQALVRHVSLLEPADKAGVAALTGYLLDEGTARHTGPEIAELIEGVGGQLSLSSSGGSVRVLTPHRHLGLQLLLECLTRPNFPKDAFAREKEHLLSEIDEAEQQPESKALLAYKAMVYGKHPFGRSSLGTGKTAEPLTPADCADFHRKVFVPNNTVIALVGDFDSKEIVEEIKRLTADWKKAPVDRPELPAVTKPKEFTEKVLSMPDAAQLHFYMGHVGIRRNNPDYYKLLVMDYVLGTGPGFTDRLSSRLRDREGLAYTVTANITSSAGEEPGVFTCYIGTEPDNLGRVRKAFMEELNRIRDQKPSQEEVEDAKQYLLGNLAFEMVTSDKIAAHMLYAERYGLGFGYLDEYRKAVAAVTPEDVQAVARKYIDPEHMALIAAGAVDAQGKPLQKLPPPKLPPKP